MLNDVIKNEGILLSQVYNAGETDLFGGHSPQIVMHLNVKRLHTAMN